MKNKFIIKEKSLSSPQIDKGADIDGIIRVLTKTQSKLMNEIEKENENIEQWKKGLFRELLEVIDSLERILLQAQKMPSDAAVTKLVGHVRVTAVQLSRILQRREVVSFETVGKEAVADLTEIVSIEERDTGLNEVVIEEFEKGYLYRGKLLRRAKVKIAK
jgi:molecular chaperone GrpE